MQTTGLHKLINIKNLTDSTYILQVEKNNMVFEAGQHILHGIRVSEEAYGEKAYNRNNYIACTSRDESGDFSGRVTDYIKQNNFDKDTICYFCGNFKMIREAMDLLEKKGIPNDQLHAEVYF